MAAFPSFLWTNTIPLCICTSLSFSTPPWRRTCIFDNPQVMLRCWWPEDQAWSTTELGERLSCSIREAREAGRRQKSDIRMIVPGNSPGRWEPAPYIPARTWTADSSAQVDRVRAMSTFQPRQLGRRGFWAGSFPGDRRGGSCPGRPTPAALAERHHGLAPGCWEPGSEVSRQPLFPGRRGQRTWEARPQSPRPRKE